MTLTAEFRNDYGTTSRNAHVNDSRIAQPAQVERKPRDTMRRVVCAIGMVGPLSAILAVAAWYLTI